MVGPSGTDAAELAICTRGLVKRYPGLQVHAVVGDFENHLGEIPGGERRVVALLGSTIGNFRRNEAQGLLFDIRDVLESSTDNRRESASRTTVPAAIPDRESRLPAESRCAI